MRILIVDDEPPARLRLRTLLEMLPDADALEIVGEAEDGEAALEAIARERPDVVFLDVQMPGVDGFGVARALGGVAMADAVDGALPELVFATAYDQHAVRAFEVHAVDYLVKPFDAKRLAVALGRARERLAARRAARQVAHGATSSATPSVLAPELAALLAAVQPAPAAAYVSRLAVRVGERVYWVRAADIDWVEADGNYLRLHTGTGTPQAKVHLIRKPLAALAEALDPAQFARIHRSTLVNIDRIRELRALSDGEYQVLLTDGTKLKLSRTYRQNLPAF
jgi:two-component system LytT family response regulator